MDLFIIGTSEKTTRIYIKSQEETNNFIIYLLSKVEYLSHFYKFTIIIKRFIEK